MLGASGSYREGVEILIVPIALVLAAVVPAVHRHVQVVAWDRELDEAFGVRAAREMPRRRAL